MCAWNLGVGGGGGGEDLSRVCLEFGGGGGGGGKKLSCWIYGYFCIIIYYVCVQLFPRFMLDISFL